MALGSTRIGQFGQQQLGGSGGFSPADLDPVFWVDSSLSAVVGGKLKNLGSGGSALDATFGSTAPSAYFDGTALVLPGVAGNYASTPDAAALDITGDIEIVCRAALTDWTNGTQTLVAKRAAGQNAYTLRVLATGALDFAWWTATVATNRSSTVAPFVDGNAYWIRFTFAAGTGTCTWQYAADQATEPTSWTTLHSTAAGATSIDATTAPLVIGDNGSLAEFAAGSIRRAIVRNSIGGSAVFDADFAKPFDTTSFTATTGQTVTLTRTTSGVDTNDPTLLPHTGTNYLYLPGSTGQQATVPDNAAFTPTTSISYRMVVALDDWTPSSITYLGGHYEGGGNQRSSLCAINATSGVPFFNLSSDGITAVGPAATAVPTVADGAKLALRYDWLAAGPTVRFYTKVVSSNHYDDVTSDSGWTQLGADVTASVPATLFNPTAPMYVAGYSGSSGANVSAYAFAAKVDGVLQVGVDFATGITSGGQTSFTASTGQTVTINRTTSGRKAVAVTRPIILLGTDDYFEVPDSASLDFGASDSFTVLAVARAWTTPATNGRLLQKGAATDPRWFLFCTSTVAAGFQVTDTVTTATPSTTNGSVGALNVFAGVVDRGTQLAAAYINTTASSTSSTSLIGSLENTSVMRSGTVPVTNTSPFDGEIVAAAVFRRTLTAAEIAAIVSYYGAA